MYNTTQQQWPVVSVSGASVWSGPGSCWIFAVPDTVHQPPPGSMNVRTRVYSGITATAAPRLPPRPAGYLPVQRRGLQHPRGRRFFRKRFAGRCDTIQSIQSIHLHCHTVATLRTSHFTHNASNNKLSCHTSHITPHLTIRDLLHWPGISHQAHVTQCRLCNENFELQLRMNVASLHHFSKVSHELEDCILYSQNSCSLRCDHDMVGTCSCGDTETSDMSNVTL